VSVVDADGFFDRDALRLLGRARHDDYVRAEPFPHAVFDAFLPDERALALARDFPDATHPAFRLRDHREQKRYAQLQRGGFVGVAPSMRTLLAELLGMAFLDFLAELTGVRGLIADPHFRGAGPLLTEPGGHLAIHVDFDRDRSRRLSRAVTALLYLPREWDESWGGELELHPHGDADADADADSVVIAPLRNRLVVLAHGETHWHGQPNPVSAAARAPRAVIASYYYVVPDDPDGEGHSAIWK